MKKLITLAAALVLVFTVACKKETHTTVDETSTSSTSTYSTEVPAVDTAAINDAASDVNDAAANATAATATAARDAAHATGTAMETAGQEIQDRTRTDTTGTR